MWIFTIYWIIESYNLFIGCLRLVVDQSAVKVHNGFFRFEIFEKVVDACQRSFLYAKILDRKMLRNKYMEFQRTLVWQIL